MTKALARLLAGCEGSFGEAKVHVEAHGAVDTVSPANQCLLVTQAIGQEVRQAAQ